MCYLLSKGLICIHKETKQMRQNVSNWKSSFRTYWYTLYSSFNISMGLKLKKKKRWEVKRREAGTNRKCDSNRARLTTSPASKKLCSKHVHVNLLLALWMCFPSLLFMTVYLGDWSLLSKKYNTPTPTKGIVTPLIETLWLGGIPGTC